MSASLADSTRAAFRDVFGADPEFLASAPGRVELLGNHTDYNGGLVLAAAIDRATVVVGRPRPGPSVRVRSVNLGEDEAFALNAIERGEPGTWGRYVRGVAWALQARYGEFPSGFEAALAGDIPLGAGLSSSASLAAALALFAIAAGLVPKAPRELDDQSRMILANRLRFAENEFVGVNSGLLDQFSSLFGQADHALMLDCLTLSYERLPLGRPAPAIVVCDSKTSRRLADGMYNRRREECERVVAYFQRRKGPVAVRMLRDVTLDELRAAWSKLDPVGRLRARHVLTENDRVLRGSEALRNGDLATFGRLMSESHASSRDDFENSSPALDALIAAAEAAPGFLGGKLSGAGWAGCTVNLVRADAAQDFAASVADAYRRGTGLDPAIHICHAAPGASGRALGPSAGGRRPR